MKETHIHTQKRRTRMNMRVEVENSLFKPPLETHKKDDEKII